MASIFSNLTNPAGSALNNKLQSNPLSILKGPFSNGQMSGPFQPRTQPSPAPTSSSPLVTPNEYSRSAGPSRTTPTAPLASPLTPEQSSTNQGILKNIQSSQTAPVTQAAAPAYTPPVAAPVPPGGLYGRLINTLSNQGNTPNNQQLSGAIGNLNTAASGNQVYADRAKQIADSAGEAISNVGQAGARGEAGYRSTGTSPVGEGNAAILAQTTAAQQQAIAQGANMELAGNAQGLTANQQAQSGYNQAGGLATGGQNLAQSALGTAAGYAQPIQLPYSNQYIDPSTGQPIGGGQTGQLPPQALEAVNSYAQQVRDGKMTRDQAESELSTYGIAGKNALNQALGTGFNTNASNASAGTTAVGQQVKTAADSTNRALDTLSAAFDSLSSLQTGGIPLSNDIANWIGEKFGQSALSAYKTNLADARSQLIGVLNSSGGTPTGNEATAMQYLPDNMTVQQFKTNVGTAENPGIVRKLIDQKVQSFTQSGIQSGIQTGDQSNASSDGEAVSAGGYSFKKVNGKWVPA